MNDYKLYKKQQSNNWLLGPTGWMQNKFQSDNISPLIPENQMKILDLKITTTNINRNVTKSTQENIQIGRRKDFWP
jgi:hypothetical protein